MDIQSFPHTTGRGQAPPQRGVKRKSTGGIQQRFQSVRPPSGGWTSDVEFHPIDLHRHGCPWVQCAHGGVPPWARLIAPERLVEADGDVVDLVRKYLCTHAPSSPTKAGTVVWTNTE